MLCLSNKLFTYKAWHPSQKHTDTWESWGSFACPFPNIILFYLVLLLLPMQIIGEETPKFCIWQIHESPLKHLLHVGYYSLTTLQIHTIIYMFCVSQIVHTHTHITISIETNPWCTISHRLD
jgi:hypothetical protein